MSEALASLVIRHVRTTQERLLQITKDLSYEQLTWRPGPMAPAIGFHLWHIARWTDRLQAWLTSATPVLARRLGPGQELWMVEGIAKRWGLNPVALGHSETGMGMDDSQSASLKLPAKENLLDYPQRAFAAADKAVGALDDQQLRERCIDLYGKEAVVGNVLLSHLTHANRHLGMIEALRGVEGMKGTATV